MAIRHDPLELPSRGFRFVMNGKPSHTPYKYNIFDSYIAVLFIQNCQHEYISIFFNSFHIFKCRCKTRKSYEYVQHASWTDYNSSTNQTSKTTDTTIKLVCGNQTICYCKNLYSANM